METQSILTTDQVRSLSAKRGLALRPQPLVSIRFPVSLLGKAASQLQENGHRSLEQLVLWSGYANPTGALLVSLLMPKTTATWGTVTIVKTELPIIAEWLFEHGQLLFVEMHTHGPGSCATELSPIDRAHPVGRQNGFLTFIIPEYAKAGIDLATAGIWECLSQDWKRVSPDKSRVRFSVVPDAELTHELLTG